MKKTIKQTIVVEGKSDVIKLKRLFNCNTIITNGSHLDLQTLNLIKQAHLKNEVILFLDPDYQGEKIRKRIADFLKCDVKHCFISKKAIGSNNQKKGVAEAYDEAIVKAINNVSTFVYNNQETISWNDYLDLDFNSKNKRLFLVNHLKISYANHKQLFKRLNMLQKTKEEIETILLKYNKDINYED